MEERVSPDAGLSSLRRSRHARNRLPPGPRIPAAIQTLAWAKRQVPFVLRGQQRFGDAWTVRLLGVPPTVLLGHPEAVKQMLTGPPDVYLSKPPNALIAPLVGDRSIFLLDAEEHLRERKLLLPPFHGDRLNVYRDLLYQIADAEVRAWPTGQPFALAPRFREITLQLIMHAVFGVTDEARGAEMGEALVHFMDITMAATFLPVLLAAPQRATVVPSYRKARMKLDRLLAEEITKRRRASDLDSRPDVLSMLLQTTYEDGTPMSDSQVRDHLVTLMTAGHETTASTLAWAFTFLMHDAPRLQRLRDTVLADDLSYARAIGWETMRLRPIQATPYRELGERTAIGGLELEAGTRIAASAVMLHHNPEIYPNPHAFLPERFLDDRPGSYTWISFGAGRRRCVGAALAALELEVILEVVARHSEIAIHPVRQRREGAKAFAVGMVPERGAEIIRRPATRQRVVPPVGAGARDGTSVWR